MAVFLSPLGGVAAQFLDNNGVILSGGKIYTYSAGTTTNATTYTSSSGSTAQSNPIILDSAGRVPSGEIWLTDGVSYKFVIKTSEDVTIGTYDNLTGINSNFVAYTSQQEIQTATAGQTVFTLTTMQYQPNTDNLSVFVDGVNQYGPGAQYAFVETNSTTVTFTSGLHVGASVKFTTASPVASAVMNAENVAYDPPFLGGAATNVEAKLAQTVSVKDFGAVGDGVTDDTINIQAALDTGNDIIFPEGNYLISSTLETVSAGTYPAGYGQKLIGQSATLTAKSGFTGDSLVTVQSPDGAIAGWFNFQAGEYADYCVKVTSANVKIDQIRTYSFKVAGIWTGGNYGTVITSVYGQGAATSTSLIQANTTTGLIVNNPQTYRAEHYLVHITSCNGFVVNGGTPDKTDYGFYASLSQGVINGLNFEGTKYPVYSDRSYISIEGCRFVSNGGIALSPSNSTDGINLNIGTPATRKAGTYLIRGASARIEMAANGIQALSTNLEYAYWFTDASGTYSNIFIGDANQLSFADLSTNFSLTTQVYPGEPTIKVLTNTTNYTVKGTGSGQNRIELDTIELDKGFALDFDAGTYYYVATKAGYYEFDFVCELSATSTSAYVDFSLVSSVGTTIVRTQRNTVGTNAPVYFKHQLFMNVGNGIRFQGVTDALANTGVLINPQLSIAMLSNY